VNDISWPATKAIARRAEFLFRFANRNSPNYLLDAGSYLPPTGAAQREEFMSEQTISLPEENVRLNRKRERRAVVRYASKQTTACSLFPSYERFRARVENISIRGIGLTMSREFKPDSLLIIELGQRDGSTCVAIPSRVTQSLKAGGECWTIGCEFDSPLSQELLKTLV
jgi:hypothetical protein